MSQKNKKQNYILPGAIISIIALIIIWKIASFKSAPQIKPDHVHLHKQHLENSPLETPDEKTSFVNLHNSKHTPPETAPQDANNKGYIIRQRVPLETPEKRTTDVNQPKMTLEDIVRTARYWGPSYLSWHGKPATDFIFTDITGKQHKLSDYRGKQVMLIFWATWCAPCIRELPHLIALRNLISEDKLAMFAISYEHHNLVRRFAARQKINYTVISADMRSLPTPFNRVYAIPSSFFIRPDGSIKMATEGLLSLGAIKAILQAE